jgi:hypothetical protein
MALHVSIDGGYRQFAGLHNGQILFLFCASQWWPSTINPLLINVSIQKHHILLNLGEGEDAVAKDDNDDWDKKPLPISLISSSVVRLRRELFRAVQRHGRGWGYSYILLPDCFRSTVCNCNNISFIWMFHTSSDFAPKVQLLAPFELLL